MSSDTPDAGPNQSMLPLGSDRPEETSQADEHGEPHPTSPHPRQTRSALHRRPLTSPPARRTPATRRPDQ